MPPRGGELSSHASVVLARVVASRSQVCRLEGTGDSGRLPTPMVGVYGMLDGVGRGVRRSKMGDVVPCLRYPPGVRHGGGKGLTHGATHILAISHTS